MMLVVDAFTLIVLILATMFAIRILRWAKITEPLRAYIVDKTGADSLISYLFHCHYCLAPYVAAAFTLGGYTLWPHNPVMRAILVAFAVAEAAPVLHDLIEAKTKGP